MLIDAEERNDDDDLYDYIDANSATVWVLKMAS
jgi:hypothetical protein